jgi:hypothetical protein
VEVANLTLIVPSSRVVSTPVWRQQTLNVLVVCHMAGQTVAGHNIQLVAADAAVQQITRAAFITS